MTAKRILIIEDDLDLAENMSDALTLEGFYVECSNDAPLGEKLIRSGNFDIILLDHKMPVLTGTEILKQLKADHIKKRIFIISGRPSIEQILKEENVFDMVSGIIDKPINFEALLEKINQL
ncbi:MAG: response regulator [Candidatus Omnitrophota bacterium]